MKTKYIYKVIFLWIILFYSCSKENVMTFDGKGYIHFEYINDTTRFSFAAYGEEVTEVEVVVEVNLAGKAEDYDREINFAVLDDVRHPATKYELVQPAILYADSLTAQLKIKVYRTENLNDERDTLSIKLLESEDLMLGFEGYAVHTFTFYGTYDKPTWWDVWREQQIGYFSVEKYKIIIEITGLEDDSWLWDNTLSVWYPYLFNKYVEENKPTYPDGSPVTFEPYSY